MCNSWKENVISLKEFRAQLLAEEAIIESSQCLSFPTAMYAKNHDSNSGAYSSGSQGGFNSGFQNTNGFHGNSGASSRFQGGFKSKFKGKGKNGNFQGQNFYNHQGQRYYNSKPVLHDYAPGILGNPSQSNNGVSSPNVICQICSQHGHTAATCVYRNTESSSSSENCQICDRDNHTTKTCFYRNKNKTPQSQMTAMHTTFPGYM